MVSITRVIDTRSIAHRFCRGGTKIRPHSKSVFDYMAIMAIMVTMGTEKASVAHAKNTLSSLINKVAYGKTRVVLESRGKPKAALISTEDLQRLEHLDQRDVGPQNRLKMLVQAQALRGKMRRRRKKILPDSADRLNQLREQRDRGI